MDLTCPFHPKREILWWPDLVYSSDVDKLVKQKNRLFIYDYLSYLNTVQKWICPICGLQFSSERLIEHFDDKHRNEFQVPDDAICLADYCDIVRCDVLIGSESRDQSSKVVESSRTVEPKEANCDKDKLKELNDKCTRLIRQCTLGTLEIESSMNEFNELESDLSSSICSYLTCDRYWQNNLDRPKHVSITFIASIVLLMIGLFSCCYYFVWCLFESDTNYELRLGGKLRSISRVINLVNLAKSKWLCKVVKPKPEVSDVNRELVDLDLNRNEIQSDRPHDQPKAKLPFKMKQSIFSVRSSSSDSIKQMQLEHLKHLELHERRLKELERLNMEKAEKIIEEESQFEEQLDKHAFVEQNAIGQLKQQQNRFENELDREVHRHFSKRKFTKNGEIVSTKSKSEENDSYRELDTDSLNDKESFYEALSEFRKSSNNDSLRERKEQRKRSEQAVCSSSYLSCPTDELIKSKEHLDVDLERKLDNQPIDHHRSPDKQPTDQNETDDHQSPRRRLWNIAGDVTLLNTARLKLLEQRAAGRQLNYQSDEHNQSNQICKQKRKSEIELKEFKSKQPNADCSPKQQSTQLHSLRLKIKQHLNQTLNQNENQSQNCPQILSHNFTHKVAQNLNQIHNNSPTQHMDQSKESKKRVVLYKQGLASNRDETRKLVNPILNQVMFNHPQTRSQPPSLSQTPLRPSSTNSHI